MKEDCLQVYKYQVSGKTVKFVDKSKKILYKTYSPSEHKFYNHMQIFHISHPNYSLLAHLPKYYGVYEDVISAESSLLGCQQQQNKPRHQWLNHISNRNLKNSVQDIVLDKFLMMEDVTCGYGKINKIDLKLGVKKEKKTNVKFKDSTTDSHRFRINGMMAQVEGRELFISKYYGHKVTLQQIKPHLALFFYNGTSISTCLLQKTLQKLSNLILSLKGFRGLKLISSSLLICYDQNNNNNYSLKLIDFDKYEFCDEEYVDNNVIDGLINVYLFLKDIFENVGEYQSVLAERKLGCFGDVQVVPKDKYEKYK